MKQLAILAFTTALMGSGVHAQQLDLDAGLLPLSAAETPAVLDTLRALTAVDSGSGQAAGFAAVAEFVEFILIDRIPRRLTLVAEMIRALARKP